MYWQIYAIDFRFCKGTNYVWSYIGCLMYSPRCFAFAKQNGWGYTIAVVTSAKFGLNKLLQIDVR